MTAWSGHTITGLGAPGELPSFKRCQRMGATLSVEWCCWRCPCRRDVQATWAAVVPPVGDNGTHRNSGQGRGSDAALSGRLSAERLAERGARGVPPSEGSTAPDMPGGELGSPNSPISRWQHDIDSDRNSGAARSVVTRRCCCLCDRRLLESRSPRRDASADRRWRWPGGCLRENRRSTPRLPMGR